MSSTPTWAPLFLSKKQLAYELGLSERHVSRMRSAGKLPKPLKLGSGDKSLRWSRAEVAAWRDAGCPTLSDWEAQKRDGEPVGIAMARVMRALGGDTG